LGVVELEDVGVVEVVELLLDKVRLEETRKSFTTLLQT
jgi:hypothetical protein